MAVSYCMNSNIRPETPFFLCCSSHGAFELSVPHCDALIAAGSFSRPVSTRVVRDRFVISLLPKETGKTNVSRFLADVIPALNFLLTVECYCALALEALLTRALEYSSVFTAMVKY